MHAQRETSPLRGAAAGALAGLAGSYFMTVFLRALEKAGADHPHHPQHSVNRGETNSTAEDQPGSDQDDATVELVERICRAAGIELSQRGKRLAGPIAHYGFGAVTGALYGLAAARDPRATAGFGLAFGALVWLLADEISIPALKLAPPPWKTPWQVHARAAAAHVIYGPGTEAVRRALA